MALIDAGEAIKELGEVKDALDMEVKQNFIDPLQNLHDKDLKEIQVRKLLCGRLFSTNVITDGNLRITSTGQTFGYLFISNHSSPNAASFKKDGGPSFGL